MIWKSFYFEPLEAREVLGVVVEDVIPPPFLMPKCARQSVRAADCVTA